MEFCGDHQSHRHAVSGPRRCQLGVLHSLVPDGIARELSALTSRVERAITPTTRRRGLRVKAIKPKAGRKRSALDRLGMSQKRHQIVQDKLLRCWVRNCSPSGTLRLHVGMGLVGRLFTERKPDVDDRHAEHRHADG
jgi:hypothetical protein